MKKFFVFLVLFFVAASIMAQGDNEIQVYASPTIQNKWTIFELHSNYTLKGSKFLADPKAANWLNETLEITYGFGKISNWVFTHLPANRLGEVIIILVIRLGQGLQCHKIGIGHLVQAYLRNLVFSDRKLIAILFGRGSFGLL